ncbi:ligand-binding sensor domain-containing protein [Negadavirga shengliensis]|uniref:Two-component regulator propeller domain-containing protein n=1 Tax=Negadavirga shengliensis TaxID=1389218 RepID=A0ABV9T1G7_9BACT
MKIRLYICIWFFICFGQVFAQSGRKFFNHFTTKDGLASNHVFCIWKDPQGTLWLGTMNGLQRYDGRFFRYYSISSPYGLPPAPVFQIMDDREGRIWIKSGESYGIFDPGNKSFQRIPFSDPTNREYGDFLWKDSEGDLHVVIKRKGVFSYDPENQHFNTGSAFVQLPEDYRINNIYEDQQSGLFYFTCVEGLVIFDKNSGEVYSRHNNPIAHPLLEKEDFYQMTGYFIDEERNHWITYWPDDQVILRFNEKTGEYADFSSSLVMHQSEYNQIDASFQTSGSILWKFGFHSLFLYDSISDGFVSQRTDKLIFGNAYQMVEDEEGSVWFATDEGLFQIPGKTGDIQHTLLPDEVTENGTVAVAEIDRKPKGKPEFWLANWGKGVLVYDHDFNQQPNDFLYTSAPNLSEIKQTWQVLQDSTHGKVWIGCQSGWLHLFDPATDQSFFINPPAVKNSTIRAIAQDKKGNVWLGTQNGKVVKFPVNSPVSATSFELVHNFNVTITFLYPDDKDNLWIATSGKGIHRMDLNTGEINLLLNDRVLSGNNMEKIIRLTDSVMVFGGDLLNLYNVYTRKNQVLSYAEGLSSNKIQALLTDPSGHLWIYTPNGICRYNPKNKSILRYESRDGFLGLEPDGFWGINTRDGRLLFLGFSSLFAFRPEMFEPELTPQKPFITYLQLFNKELYVDSLLSESKRTFGHQQNSFTFYYNTTGFLQQRKLKYYHRLINLETDWVSADEDNKAVYSYLPPGNYIFQVKTENEEGESSETVDFSFSITPPFFETWWFRTLLILLAGGIIAGAYRLHLNRMLAVVALRNRVARDLHDDMGSTLSTINILSSMAKTKLHTDPVKTSEYISKISDNSQRMMEAMDDIVWSIKPQNDSMDKIISRMRGFAAQLFEAKDINYTFEVEENVLEVKLPMDARRDLFLIFKEAVNNLAKYSGSKEAMVHFSLKNNKLNMRVKDYGRGFDPLSADSGNGLSNMKKRAQNMRAYLIIHSKVGNGSEIQLHVPL